MSDEQPEEVKVPVETLKYHTTEGKEYQVGDVFDVPESALGNLLAQGLVIRVSDREAQKAAEAEKPPA